MSTRAFDLRINGESRTVTAASEVTLLELLRGPLGLVGTESSCRRAHAPPDAAPAVDRRLARVARRRRLHPNRAAQRRLPGGPDLTGTDIAVAAGLLSLGDARHVAGLDARTVARTLDVAAAMLAEAVDRMKTDAEEVPLLAVGGGGVPGAGQAARDRGGAASGACRCRQRGRCRHGAGLG